MLFYFYAKPAARYTSSARAKEHTGRGRVEAEFIQCHVTLPRFCRLRATLSNSAASIAMPAASNFQANWVLLKSLESKLNVPAFSSMCLTCEGVFGVLFSGEHVNNLEKILIISSMLDRF